jgi:hypothetical protein
VSQGEADFIGMGIPDNPDRLMRCGCRGLLVLECVDGEVYATCPHCEATWDMRVEARGEAESR